MTDRGREFLKEVTPHELRLLRKLCFSFEVHGDIARRFRLTEGAVRAAQHRLAQKAEVDKRQQEKGRGSARHRLLLFCLANGIFDVEVAREELAEA